MIERKDWQEMRAISHYSFVQGAYKGFLGPVSDTVTGSGVMLEEQTGPNGTRRDRNSSPAYPAQASDSRTPPGQVRHPVNIRGEALSLHPFPKKSRWCAWPFTIVPTAVRASPGRRSVPRYLSKVPAQMWLVGESALQCYLAY
jgi:hypothetical protein